MVPYKPPFAVSYNPILFLATPPPKRYALHKELGLGADIPIIGTACRIAEQKNPISFTKVMIGVLLRNPQAHAVVLGNDVGDAFLSRLRTLIENAKVGDRFHLLGYRVDAPQLVQDLNCFIMTSHWEGLPTTLLEAMNVETPIAFMRGRGGLVDLAELNAYSNTPFALIADKDDEDGMAEQIATLIEHPQQAQEMTQCAKQILRKYFTVDAVAHQLSSIYQSLLEEAS